MRIVMSCIEVVHRVYHAHHVRVIDARVHEIHRHMHECGKKAEQMVECRRKSRTKTDAYEHFSKLFFKRVDGSDGVLLHGHRR